MGNLRGRAVFANCLNPRLGATVSSPLTCIPDRSRGVHGNVLALWGRGRSPKGGFYPLIFFPSLKLGDRDAIWEAGENPAQEVAERLQPVRAGEAATSNGRRRGAKSRLVISGGNAWDPK